MLLLLVIVLIFGAFKVFIIASGVPFDLRTLLNPLSEFLHGNCVRLTSGFSIHSESAAALVCGHQIETLNIQSTFVSSGLIHLLVVSGSHLLLIAQVLDFLKIKAPVKIAILFLFVLVCEMNAPITRSFVALALTQFVKNKKWVWTKNFKHWITSFLCLVINPFWIFSLSFQMSWLASLCLDLACDFYNDDRLKQNLLRTALIYFAFFFIFGLLGFPSFWAPLISLILSPVLEFLLFPMAFIGCLISPLAFIFDGVFSWTLILINFFNPERNFLIYFDRESVLNCNAMMIIFLLMLQLKLQKVKI